jgi:deubiquitinase DESI2
MLTSRPAPRWLNRAASIGVALPCVVPREWLAPPDFETADGELLDDDDEDVSRHTSRRGSESTDADEHVGLLRQSVARSGINSSGVRSGISSVRSGRRGDLSAPSGSSRASSAGRSPSQQRNGRRMKTLFRDDVNESAESLASSGGYRDSSGREIPPSERAPVPRGRH